jgi:membrane associated rhomboid family serine protease
VLLENTPFFTAFELPTLAVLAALDGVAHGGHFGGFFFSLYLLDKEEKNSSGARKVRKKNSGQSRTQVVVVSRFNKKRR